MDKIDKIFKYSAITNTLCILLPLLFIILTLCLIYISEKISEYCFYATFFIALFGVHIYLITLAIILITFIITLFKKSKTKKDYISIFLKLAYIALLILFTITIVIFCSML